MNQIAQGAGWPELYARARAAAPEAFGEGGQVHNLLNGGWQVHTGETRLLLSPNDGTPLARLPLLSPEAATRAVEFAAQEHQSWQHAPLAERQARVEAALAGLREHRDLLALLLCWEIGKPHAQALVSVDRTISGVEWYLEQIGPMLNGRRPLGLISNIASWNYPLSVLMHALLVQMLAGNAAIAKTPSDGGLCALTLAVALARRAGLPVSLVSGSGSQLSEALVRHPLVKCVAFVAGKGNGRAIAASLQGLGKRYMLEMEGLNAYGVWDFSDWSGLAAQIKKGFEYAKQRCTAYPRFVVQRRLVAPFLEMYLDTVRGLRFGHPLIAGPDGKPLNLDFGPLIHADKVRELRHRFDDALSKGAVPLYQGALDCGPFLPGQDQSAYFAPALLANVPRSSSLYHAEPFGPLDSLVVVDTPDELISEMNVSGGALVGSIASDNLPLAHDLAGRVNAFKVGVNRVRSRGDREEPFGGSGESWKGCFVGGAHLVQAVTCGPVGEQLAGNFPEYALLPA